MFKQALKITQKNTRTHAQNNNNEYTKTLTPDAGKQIKTNKMTADPWFLNTISTNKRGSISVKSKACGDVNLPPRSRVFQHLLIQ